MYVIAIYLLKCINTLWLGVCLNLSYGVYVRYMVWLSYKIKLTKPGDSCCS